MIKVLRLNHRIARDARLTTHVGLISRAFGADEFILSGDEDRKLLSGLDKVTEQFGGPFETKYVKQWKPFVNKEKKNCKVVHLTAYGSQLQDVIKDIRKEKNLIVVIGSAKVPPAAYEVADWNVSVTNQPHSEAGALAVFLHEYFQGKELTKEFKKSKKKIIPQAKGKRVISS
ncbi:MAG: tRNA (cytidine(56)-2'-O)-methyltransferase [Candidatus Diapherotrites archaeon]|nr:tRNA (cytidine(56)-2'-O)-methyltransferase [Candidatus Diapherotrites archaeon]